jgi:hypothetical protein
MASTTEILGILQIVVIAILLIALVLYQPNLPRWVFGILVLYIMIGLIQILASLQGNDRYFFLYSLSLGILLLILYLYYVM